MPPTLVQEPKIHALNLPEIAYHLAQYLDAKSILACSVVSKSLYRSLYPLVWQDLHFGRPCTNDRDQAPLARILSIIPSDESRGKSERSRMKFMLQKAPWIVSLSIHNHDSISALQLGAACTRLESIAINGLTFKGRTRHSLAYWDTCEAILETLELDHVNFELSWPRPRNKVHTVEDGTLGFFPSSACCRFPRLQELRLSCMKLKSPHRQLTRLIKQCPDLKTLHWDVSNKVLPVELLHGLLQVDTWPNLESIAIVNFTNAITDDQQSRLLSAVKGRLRQFVLGNSPIGDDTYETLRTLHAATIERIDLSTGPRDTSAWTAEILATCPSLRTLIAGIVRSQHIFRYRAWACTSLQKLVIFIDMEFPYDAQDRRFTEEEIEQCRSIYARIGDLKHLQILDMLSPFQQTSVKSDVSCTDPSHGRFQMIPLPLRLKAGLDQLAGLTRLNVVAFHGGKHAVHQKDLEWMLHHWKSFKTLQGSWWIRKGTANFVRHKYLWSGYLKYWINIRGISTDGSGFDEYAGEYGDNEESKDVWID
ncbi:hypothetical protein BGX31_008231 [Mortierella sp. GBA43]|nr:hypothetical protein BGX31_008231 [Mortierella sp. GBA43]